MVDLRFTVEGVGIERFAVAPTILFKLRIANAGSEARVQNVLLQCQLRIEATRRRYAPRDQERLTELFGEAHRWDETLRSMLWTQTTVQVPAFDAECSVDLPVACSFDFNVAVTKYFSGLEGGEVPLAFLFSGTVFYRDADGFLQMDQIPWSKEAEYRLPVSVWEEMMQHFFPGSAWVQIEREVFEEFYRFKRHKGFTSWDQTLRALLDGQREESVP
jgi:hypothetical protein